MGGSSSSTAFNYDAQLLADTKEQSVQVGDEVKGETRPRRNKQFPTIVSHPYPDEKGGLTTIWEGFQRGVQRHPKANCLGTRKYAGVDEKREYKKSADGLPIRTTYVWEDYSTVDTIARAFGSGLIELGAKAKDNIGIWSINRAEWVISAFGFYSQNMRTVSLYATLGDEAVAYIINHAEISIVVTEKENVKKLIKSKPSLPGLKIIIQFDPVELYGTQAEYIDEAQVKAATEAGIQLIGWGEVVKMGTAKAHFPVPPSEEDLAFVMYTSGTTGMPKGALLRHGNVMAAVAACPSIFNLREGQESHVSYLPLAHIFETVVQSAIFAVGGAVGFFQGNVKKLTNDFVDLQPTILCGVPRVFSKIYQKVFQGVTEKNCMVKWYFNKAYSGQCDNLRNGRPRDVKYDNKVFIPLRQRIGMGKCRIIITGAAPCPPYLLEFLRVISPGGNVVQGYGLTETAAATSITVGTDPNMGHTGPPLPCNEVKLVDVPEMGYLATDKNPRGEIWVRGPNIFAGYYKNEEATREALDEKGWLRTGDVGRWNPNGTLSVIDRKKNIFKLSQGEYIAAEKIETVYGKSPIVGQVWVYGNSYKPFCMAVVVPAADIVAQYCQEKGWWPSPKEASVPGTAKFAEDFAAVFRGEHAGELKKYIHDTMKQQETALKGFEKVQDILIESRIDAQMAGFTEANECLTPTFKLRRPYLLQRYMADLKKLYEQHGEPDKPDEKWPGEK